MWLFGLGKVPMLDFPKFGLFEDGGLLAENPGLFAENAGLFAENAGLLPMPGGFLSDNNYYNYV